MEAHGEDLRKTGVSEDVVRALKSDWGSATLSDVDRAICKYADKLTRTPSAMAAEDIESLRAVSLDDRTIHDVCAVTAYFAYINRIADGLGVDVEPEMAPTPAQDNDNARP
jgi:uncharacterized peroxidase-related enzyme